MSPYMYHKVLLKCWHPQRKGDSYKVKISFHILIPFQTTETPFLYKSHIFQRSLYPLFSGAGRDCIQPSTSAGKSCASPLRVPPAATFSLNEITY